MGKQLCSVLIASAALMMLAIPPSWAASDGQQGGNSQRENSQGGNNQGGNNQGGNNQAPEINVGAGGAGLTVLAIALLLAAERRSRSS